VRLQAFDRLYSAPETAREGERDKEAAGGMVGGGGQDKQRGDAEGGRDTPTLHSAVGTDPRFPAIHKRDRH
jgi:hypothetical protein